MYPTLYRLTQNGYLICNQVKVGVRRTRVYYEITPAGQEHLQNLKREYASITGAVDKIITIDYVTNSFDHSKGHYIEYMDQRDTTDTSPPPSDFTPYGEYTFD